jgi:hypothetical protein
MQVHLQYIVGYKCNLYMEVQGKCQKPKCRCSLVVHIVQSQYANARKSMSEVQGKSQASETRTHEYIMKDEW